MVTQQQSFMGRVSWQFMTLKEQCFLTASGIKLRPFKSVETNAFLGSMASKLASISPSDERMLAHSLLSAWACSTMDFWILLTQVCAFLLRIRVLFVIRIFTKHHSSPLYSVSSLPTSECWLSLATPCHTAVTIHKTIGHYSTRSNP